MKVIEEIRLDNLRQLVADAGNIATFARKINKRPDQVWQLLNKSPDSKTGAPKNIGSKQARQIEDLCGKETGWMDHDHSDREADLFRQLPAEVRAWLIKRGHPGDQSAAPSEKKRR